MTEIVGVQTPNKIGDIVMSDGSSVIYDGLQKNNFKLYFPRLPKVIFAMQSFELPSMSINNVNQPTRFVDANEIGEKVNFEPYRISFVVDKYLRNYIEAFHWMKRMTVAGTNVGEVDDAVLFINDQATFKFVGSWITELGGIDFDTTESEGLLVTSSLTINYDYLDYIGQYKNQDSVY